MEHQGKFVIIPTLAVKDKRLTDKQLKILCVLSTYLNDRGFCWPSMKTLAGVCDCDRTTILRNIKTLIDLGYLRKEPLFLENEGQTVNAYFVTYDLVKMQQECCTSAQECCTSAQGGECTSAQGGSASVHTKLYIRELNNFTEVKNNAQARACAYEEKKDEYEDRINETDEERFIEIEREMHEVFTKREEWSWIRSVEFWKIDKNKYHCYTGTRFITEHLQNFDFESRFLAMESIRGLEFTFGTNLYNLPAEYYKLNKTA